MKTIVIFILLLFLNSFIKLNGQLFNTTVFEEGYIITLNNDTIKGFIKVEDNYSGIINYKFKKGDNKIQEIKASSVKLLYMNYSYFERIDFDNESFLLERVLIGKISLYRDRYTPKGTVTVNITPSTGGMSPGMSGGGYYKQVLDLYVVKDKKVIEIKKRKLHKVLKELMIENKGLYDEIDKLEYSSDQVFFYRLKDLISKYNLQMRLKQ
jgi:hypothetical protein